MADDEIAVELVSEQRGKAAVALGRLEGIQAAIGQARDARLEIEPEQVHDREHDVGDAATIDMQRGEIGVAFVTEDAIERMDRLTGSARYHRLMQRCVTVGDGGVDFDNRIAAVMRVDQAACLADATQIIGLTIGRGAPAFTKPRRHRLGVYGVGQTAERGAERLFAHVPGLHSQERATRCHAADFGHAGEAQAPGNDRPVARRRCRRGLEARPVVAQP